MESVFEFLNIKRKIKNSPSSEGVGMGIIESLSQLEADQRERIQDNPNDEMWVAYWKKRADATKNQIDVLKEKE